MCFAYSTDAHYISSYIENESESLLDTFSYNKLQTEENEKIQELSSKTAVLYSALVMVSIFFIVLVFKFFYNIKQKSPVKKRETVNEETKIYPRNLLLSVIQNTVTGVVIGTGVTLGTKLVGRLYFQKDEKIDMSPVKYESYYQQPSIFNFVTCLVLFGFTQTLDPNISFIQNIMQIPNAFLLNTRDMFIRHRNAAARRFTGMFAQTINIRNILGGNLRAAVRGRIIPQLRQYFTRGVNAVP
jgi:hypothetical protein